MRPVWLASYQEFTLKIQTKVLGEPSKKIRHIFRRFLYLLYWWGVSPLLKFCSKKTLIVLTCTRGDGGGAQWHGRFSVMAFANEHGMGYLHADIDVLMPVDDPSIRNRWSALFSGDYDSFSDLPKAVRVRSSFGLLGVCIKSATNRRASLINLAHLHAFTDLFPQSIERAITRHKLKYENPAGIPDFSPSSGPTLAMHLRRGLDWEQHFTSNRFTADKVALDRLNKVIAEVGPCSGSVFCGLPNSVIEGQLPEGILFDSESDEFEVIHRMITADNLVMAKSCMSYIAGCFSLGNVFYEPFFHPPLKNWRVIK